MMDQNASDRYRNMPNDALYSNFRNSNWSGSISTEDRRAMIQEALRRDMAAQGVAEKDVPLISFHKEAEMPNCDGMFRESGYGGKEIWINEAMVDNSRIVGNGEGFDLLNATFHEGRHAYQSLALEGKVQKGYEPDEKSMELLRANDHDIVIVSQGGKVQLGQTYLDGQGGAFSENLYRLQYKERDADIHATESVGRIVDRQKQLTEREQMDPGLSPEARYANQQDLKDMANYERVADNYSVTHQIENANNWYFTSSADRDVDHAMLNLYHGDHAYQADPLIENQVRRESVNSYTRAYNESRGISAVSRDQGEQLAQSDQNISHTASHGRRM